MPKTKPVKKTKPIFHFEPQQSFKANRPFVYLIANNNLKTLIFGGVFTGM